MRPAPGPVPKKLPNVSDVTRMIIKMMNRPDIRLADHSIASLWETFGDGTPAWITGSNVWMPAVYGVGLAEPADYDVVFMTPEGCDRFVKGALSELNRRLPPGTKQYTLGQSKFGSHRILHPDGRGIIDAWSLGSSESIGEVLMTYPHPYQRAAFLLSRSPSPGCLFRVVGEFVSARDEKQSVGIFGRIAQASGGGYPGARVARPTAGLLDKLR